MRRSQVRTPYRLLVALSAAVLAASFFTLALIGPSPSWGVDPPGAWQTLAPERLPDYAGSTPRAESTDRRR